MSQTIRTCVGILILNLAAVSVSDANPRRVLVLNPFGRDVEPFSAVVSAFRSTLIREVGEPVDLHEIPLELARFTGTEGEGPLVDFLEDRIRSQPIDLVVPIGSAGAQFAARHRERLFPATPVLIVGAELRMVPAEFRGSNATLVTQKVDLPGMVEDILEIQPKTTHIAVVFGASPLESFWVEECRREFEAFADRVEFLWLNNLTMDQIVERCATLPQNSFILKPLFIVDAAGIPSEKNEALRRLHASANAPLFGYFESEMGLGLIGGRLYENLKVGVEGARTALRILHGEKAENIPFQVLEPAVPIYDWRELKRWGIDEDGLPADAVIAFRQPDFWEHYRGRIAGAVLLGTLQTFLIVGLLVNRARRRQGEVRLQQLSLAVEQSPVLVVITDLDGKMIYVNRKFSEVTGYSLEECLGRNPRILKSGESPPSIYEGLWARITSGKTWRGEFHNRKKNGELYWEKALISPLLDAGGTVTHYVGVKEDITEQRQAKLEVLELRDTLAHTGRVTLLGNLASALAHELSQPLGAILRNAEAAEILLGETDPDWEELKAIVTDILKDDQRASQVIDKLRSLLQRGSLDLQPVELAEVIAEVISLVHSDATARQVKVAFSVPANLPPVLGDRIHLQQVLLNLFANAMDALGEKVSRDGFVKIEARPADASTVEVRVFDNGPGITDENFGRLFEAFFTTKSTGMGMGLPVSKTIIEAHGGKLWAENRTEGGACFCFTLQAVPGEGVSVIGNR